MAKELFDFVKTEGSDKLKALRRTTSLTKSGNGIPEPILVEFEKSFLASLKKLRYESDGYAYWRHNGSESKFEFLVADRLIDMINKSDWAKSAKQTHEGVKQVQAVGGDDLYNRILGSATKLTTCTALKRIVGSPIEIVGQELCILSPAIKMDIAAENSTDFESMLIFYKFYGSSDDLKKRYKLAKKLITGNLLNKKQRPSKGPYYRH